MAKTKKKAKKPAKKHTPVHRFAHPFYKHTPANAKGHKPKDANAIAKFTANALEQIPPPHRDPTMTLDEVIGGAGATGIKQSGKIVFHACGDSGNPNSGEQELVCEAMTADYDTTNPQKSPALFLHLGDVIYYDNTDSGYHQQFYAPYKKYPGKIIAIPGNHDGEMFKFDGSPTGQKESLGAFQENFCQPAAGVPAAAGTIYRQMVSQPAVYWHLDAPFVDVVGLYSNVGETSGFISDPAIGTSQKDWLIQTLTAIAAARAQGNRRALVLAVHHPLYSNGGHEPSQAMQLDIDDACKKGGLMPDVVLCAHAHNYQRYTRRTTFQGKKLEIPVIVVGTAGRGIQSLTAATGQVQGEVTYYKSMTGYGFERMTVQTAGGAATKVLLEFVRVDKNPDATAKATLFDKAKLDLATSTVS